MITKNHITPCKSKKLVSTTGIKFNAAILEIFVLNRACCQKYAGIKKITSKLLKSAFTKLLTIVFNHTVELKVTNYFNCKIRKAFAWNKINSRFMDEFYSLICSCENSFSLAISKILNNYLVPFQYTNELTLFLRNFRDWKLRIQIYSYSLLTYFIKRHLHLVASCENWCKYTLTVSSETLLIKTYGAKVTR